MSDLIREKGKASKARLLAVAMSEFARRGYHDVKSVILLTQSTGFYYDIGDELSPCIINYQ